MDVKRTGSFSFLGERSPWGQTGRDEALAAVVEGLAVPAAILESSGIVIRANRAIAGLLRVDRKALEDEPLLSWIRRSNEREAFGREFMGLRKRSVGHAFVRELELAPRLGPAVQCTVRACRLSTVDRHRQPHILVTCERAQQSDAEAELGRAVTRALDGLEQGVFLVDGEGRIVHANPAANELLGDGLIGRGLLEMVRPAAQEELGRALTLARAGSWYGELDLRRLDGEDVPVELSIAAGRGDGAPSVVLCRDLRETRRRAFEERLAGQIDRALVSSVEPRDAVMAACRALGVGMEASKVSILTKFSGAWERWEVCPEEALPYVSVPVSAAPGGSWASQTSVTLIEHSNASAGEFEAFFGEFREDEVATRLTLRAPGGVVGYLLLTYERRNAPDEHGINLIAQLAPQLALGLANGLLVLETRALAAYQGRVLDQTTVMLNSVDADGRVVTWNRASERLLGFSSTQANGKVFGLEVARVEESQRWEQLWTTLREQGVIASELVIEDAKGKKIPVHLEGRLLRDGEQIRGAVLVGLDLRVRRALETQVLRSQKMAAVGLLAAGIAHEINNPLTGVVGYSKLLLERKLPEDIKEPLLRIQQSAERCRKIVEGVLLFSRSHEGGQRSRVDLVGLIDRVVRVGEYQWKMHNVRIMRDIADSIHVMADEDQIEQVLLNLLSNAVDAMPNGGTVYIALSRRKSDGWAALAVTDQGGGIREEIRDSIFDPFFSTKEVGKGTGLGLSISYGLVKDHGGDILLESTAGQGTTFTVVLPPDGHPASSQGDDSSEEIS